MWLNAEEQCVYPDACKQIGQVSGLHSASAEETLLDGPAIGIITSMHARVRLRRTVSAVHGHLSGGGVVMDVTVSVKNGTAFMCS